MANSFIHHTRIRFHQADPAGVLFFGRVTELFQAAYEELIAAMGLEVRDHFAPDHASTPIVHLEVDYHAPMYAGEHVAVEVSVVDIGRRSFTLSCTVRGAGSQETPSGSSVEAAVGAANTAKAAKDARALELPEKEPRVSARIVFVYTVVEERRFIPAPLPDTLREGLKAFSL